MVMGWQLRTKSRTSHTGRVEHERLRGTFALGTRVLNVAWYLRPGCSMDITRNGTTCSALIRQLCVGSLSPQSPDCLLDQHQVSYQSPLARPISSFHRMYHRLVRHASPVFVFLSPLQEPLQFQERLLFPRNENY